MVFEHCLSNQIKYFNLLEKKKKTDVALMGKVKL